MSDLVKMPQFAHVNDVVEWQAARIKVLEAQLNLKLATDVKIYPATIIRAGCTVETVIRSIEVRRAASLLENKP